jgi:hypothetical protein
MCADAPVFNPLLPEVHEDPYPLYHRLRAEDPVPVTFNPSGQP